VKKSVPQSKLEELCALLNVEVISYTKAIKEYKDFGEVEKIAQRIKHLQYLIDLALQEILS
jgi:hypothetical protein